jgi:hypothetical protein
MTSEVRARQLETTRKNSEEIARRNASQPKPADDDWGFEGMAKPEPSTETFELQGWTD